MHSPETLALVPRISEKTFLQSEVLKTYTFDVPVTANKHEIAAAVEKQFKVTVTGVKTTIIKGKAKRSVRRRRQPVTGKRSDYKKAYVTLAEGDSITVFEEGS